MTFKLPERIVKMNNVKVQNMKSSNGNTIANQFEIFTNEGKYFQSYSTIIAFKPFTVYVDCPDCENRFSVDEVGKGETCPHCGEGLLIEDETLNANKIKLDENSWDYSRTTGKYRNLFLQECKAETEKKIESGEYILIDLN